MWFDVTLKIGHQISIYLKKIVGCVITILSSIVNVIEGDLYDHSMSTRIFNLMMNKIFI